VWTQQSLAYEALRHRLAGMSVLGIVRSDFATALVWALFTLGIFGVASRYPITSMRNYSRIIAYAAGGIGVAVVNVLSLRIVGEANFPLLSQPYMNMFTLNLTVYAAMLALGHRRQLARWLFERETTAARLVLELADARSRAMQLRADPDLLLTALERFARSVTVDPSSTERGLARLADYLRISLDPAPPGHALARRAAALAALREELSPESTATGAGAA
jgi:hypothetical protein